MHGPAGGGARGGVLKRVQPLRAVLLVRSPPVLEPGRTLRTLIHGRLPAGRHVASFDAAGLAAGVHYIALDAGDARRSARVICLR